jgi:hypothetical protein
MPETSAYIHVGPLNRDGFGGGPPGPTHVLYVSEASRVALRLVQVEPLGESAPKSVTWIPRRPETILDDAIVMIASLVVQDADTTTALRVAGVDPLADWLELPDSVGEVVAIAAASLSVASIVVSVREDSTLSKQLGRLDRVGGEVEILTSSYLRFQRGGEIVARGRIPS